MNTAVQSQRLWRAESIPSNLVLTDSNQPRSARSKGDQAALMDSMKLDGQTTPVLVYMVGDKYKLVDGEGRLLAARELGWTNIMAVIMEDRPDDLTLLKMQSICNTIRSDLTLRDRLMQCFKLKQLGMSHEEIGRVLQIQKSGVSKVLKLENLEPEQLEQLQDAGIGLETAYELAKTADEDRQDKIDEACRAKASQTKLPKVKSSGQTNYLFPLKSVLFQCKADSSFGVEEMLAEAAELVRILKKAKRQGLALPTLSKVLKDQACQTTEATYP